MGLLDILQRYDAVERITRFICHKDIVPSWGDWCVGIAADAERKLREEHIAPRGLSIAVSVQSATIAKSVQKHLIKHYGMDGGPNDGEDPCYVYAFKKPTGLGIQSETSENRL